MLKVLNLEAGYGKLRVLKGISMHVSPGEIVTIIGANGAGKTTLLNTISGIIKSQSGEMLFNKTDIRGMPVEKIVLMGCVLVPEGRQVFSPNDSKGKSHTRGLSKKESRQKKEIKKTIDEVFELFPILRERQGQLAGTLSGGEQQMLAFGRALMSKPSLIMMDEPSMGIAPIIAGNIFETIVKLKNNGMTVLLIEQNARAALNIADRGYVLETGQIVLEGSSKELQDNHDVQRAYLGKDYHKINE